MSKPTILVVEDEVAIRSMLRYALETSDFIVQEAADCRAAIESLHAQAPDLILLDWMLPQQSGIEFARQLKQHKVYRNIPVIMLTAKAEEENKVLGLESGADDYIVKPFSPRELVARVRAVLRRGPMKNPEGVLQAADLRVEVGSQRVSINETLLKLGPLEFRLLCFFLKHQDRVYSRDELLSHVWGGDTYVDERTVDVHIRRLRKHLMPYHYDKFIQTVHGSGYRFSEKAYA